MSKKQWYELGEPAAQGDVFAFEVPSVPETARAVDASGPVIVAHSETGHHHQFAKDSGVTLYLTDDPSVCFLRCETDAMLEHMRSWDRHAPITFGGGRCYEVHRHKEMWPDGWELARD